MFSQLTSSIVGVVAGKLSCGPQAVANPPRDMETSKKVHPLYFIDGGPIVSVDLTPSSAMAEQDRLYRISTTPDGVQLGELFLSDTLDSLEFDRLNESLLGAVHDNPNADWILDLSQTKYMGSAVLGLLVNIRQRVKQGGGQLVLCGLTPQLEQIFRACCMERLFTMTKSREEALRKIG